MCKSLMTWSFRISPGFQSGWYLLINVGTLRPGIATLWLGTTNSSCAFWSFKNFIWEQGFSKCLFLLQTVEKVVSQKQHTCLNGSRFKKDILSFNCSSSLGMPSFCMYDSTDWQNSFLSSCILGSPERVQSLWWKKYCSRPWASSMHSVFNVEQSVLCKWSLKEIKTVSFYSVHEQQVDIECINSKLS